MQYHKFTWYNQKSQLDNPETIHQIMSFGEIDDIKKMEQLIGIKKIKELYLKYPKVYSRSVFLFINNYILKTKEPIDEQKYLKNTSRNIE